MGLLQKELGEQHGRREEIVTQNWYPEFEIQALHPLNTVHIKGWNIAL